MKSEKQIIKELARDIMDLSDRKGWGLGECWWNLNRNALDEIEECDAYIGLEQSYDTKEPEEKCTGSHAEHLKLAKHYASEAYEMASQLEDMGIHSIN